MWAPAPGNPSPRPPQRYVCKSPGLSRIENLQGSPVVEVVSMFTQTDLVSERCEALTGSADINLLFAGEQNRQNVTRRPNAKGNPSNPRVVDMGQPNGQCSLTGKVKSASTSSSSAPKSLMSAPP